MTFDLFLCFNVYSRLSIFFSGFKQRFIISPIFVHRHSGRAWLDRLSSHGVDQSLSGIHLIAGLVWRVRETKAEAMSPLKRLGPELV